MNDIILYVDDDEPNLVVLQAACGRDLNIVIAKKASQSHAKQSHDGRTVLE